MVRYSPYGYTRINNHRGSWSEYINKEAREVCAYNQRHKAGGQKTDPSETENERILAMSKHIHKKL